CENCGKKGHTKDQCWKEGGRKAGQVPKWFKGKGSRKKKEKPSEKAAAATTAASANTTTQPRESPHLNEETILFNSGASHHMSSYRNKFLNYKPIIPKPI
ncbi:hypothetical protein PISMIDRAFT_37067, partial [Pisolithus microcarpus 441]